MRKPFFSFRFRHQHARTTLKTQVTQLMTQRHVLPRGFSDVAGDFLFSFALLLSGFFLKVIVGESISSSSSSVYMSAIKQNIV